jgi:hypothetical protein
MKFGNSSRLILIIVALGLIFFYWGRACKDNFINSKYDKYVIETPKREQRYLAFLGNVHNAYNNKLKTLAEDERKKGRCDAIVSEQLENDALASAYKDTPNVPQLHKDKCISYAAHICEFTDPSIYLPDNPRAIPRWLLRSFETEEAPKNVDLNCFRSTYACCRRSSK